MLTLHLKQRQQIHQMSSSTSSLASTARTARLTFSLAWQHERKVEKQKSFLLQQQELQQCKSHDV